MADANSVTDALAEVLKDDTTDSQTVTPADTDVAKALSEVITPKVEDSTPEDKSDKSTEDEGKGAKTVPYNRLSEVVAQKNEIAERFKALDEQFQAAQTSNERLQGKITDLEEDSQILDAIKALAKDEELRPHVVAIDKALQGIEQEVVVAKEEGDTQAVTNAEKRFDAKVAELEEMQADQRAEGLWREAADHAKDMLAALPEEYTDADRATIGRLWTPRVDWSGIEDAGSEAIPAALNSSLADVIKEYGTPRGALVAQTTKEIESRMPEDQRVSPEDQLTALTEKDWSARKEDGSAVIGDDEFNSGLAAMLRLTREG